MIEREHHIKVLEQFLHDYQEWGEDLELEKTIKYAISSLKTDEAYQLMYEGGELFTKDEVADMYKSLILEIDYKYNDRPMAYNHGQRTRFFYDVREIIQNRIDALRGDTK